ncbi:hypothetical protein L6452_14575 [Arctium lappa]|uniref:Uncharacterized protein n=1 Tax=Arctium lappa TaxID=4217 RepID=A0ACB9CLV7_ARCLA|nr:hypothetical protein L6452_14575 [Arctium lappa]
MGKQGNGGEFLDVNSSHALETNLEDNIDGPIFKERVSKNSLKNYVGSGLERQSAGPSSINEMGLGASNKGLVVGTDKDGPILPKGAFNNNFDQQRLLFFRLSSGRGAGQGCPESTVGCPITAQSWRPRWWWQILSQQWSLPTFTDNTFVISVGSTMKVGLYELKLKHYFSFSLFITIMKSLTLVSSSCGLWLLFASSLWTFCFCTQNINNILCIANERSVLLQFKKNLVDQADRLSSWAGEDCCRWSGVICDNFTGHVHEIRLRGPDDGIRGHCHGSYDTDEELKEASKQMLGGTISSSLINLKQLRYLDLSCNDFGSSKIPAFIGSFQNLTYLNVSRSQFYGEIPHHLGNLSMLRVLDLHGDGILSLLNSKSLEWLKNLKRLQHLDMSGIDLERASDWLQVISTLPSLLELHFSSCGLTRIPSNPTKVSFTSLRVLDLSYNIFDSSFLPGWIFSLHNLVVFDLSSCLISGINAGTRGGFHSMPSLSTLRVTNNNFVNSKSILNELSSLTNLRVLDVSNCNLSSPILGNLQNLSLMVHIDLSNNQIFEKIPKSLSNLCNLTTLDLQSNRFHGDVSELLENFCECESPKLELLALRGNYLSGRLPEKLGRLRNLGSIDAAYNTLTGSIPDSIGSLSLLKTLQMNINQLEGPIPDTVGRLSSLNFLDLSYNKLNGSLPESIGQLGELTFASLHHNFFTGVVTEVHFANLSALKTLWVGDNKLVFKLKVPNWIPPFQLEVLRIGSSSLGPRFPLWVRSQTNLTDLDFANANISDTIPNWIWSAFSSVRFLNISHNNILGMLGDVSFLTPGAILDLSSNHFTGPLPDNFNRPDIEFLDLSYNNLSGSLDQFLCSIHEPRQLKVLFLGNNNLSGVIPNCWMNWGSLEILDLKENRLSGEIPFSLGNISSLDSLAAGNNMLSGKLPVSLLNSKSLVIIDLAENQLSGRIPAQIGRDDTGLKLLNLRSNKLEGEIPNEICGLSSLQILDLAHNHLSGNLPTCFRNFSVISGRNRSSPIILYDVLFENQVIGSASLVIKGQVFPYSTILYLVTTIDLSNNKFSGSIPDELLALSGLRYLNLSRNNLTGSISQRIGEMSQLESLDVSMNHLNGRIPLSLSVLSTLNSLNLSYNNFTGRIPTSTQLQSFNESSFIGNALCGAPLADCGQPTNDPEGTKEEDDDSDSIDWILVIVTIVGLIAGFWIMIAPLLVSKRWRNAYYHFLDKTRIKVLDSVLQKCNRFKRCEPLHGTRSSTYQVQQFDLSDYIYEQPEGFNRDKAVHEASSSTNSV